MYLRVRDKVISLNIDSIGYEEALTELLSFAKNQKPSYACFANVHMTIEAYWDKEFAEQVNGATFVFADGVPLVKSRKLLFGNSQDRIAGMDMMPSVIQESVKDKLKLFFFGTTIDVLERIRQRVEREFPEATIVGMLSPPFSKSLDKDSYINTINASGAHIVFVALGCPKQEKWMAKHSPKINAVLLGVGGAFPVYAGIQNRAPELMRNVGMEWLYRLLQDPSRLFLRYMKTNSLFILLMLKEMIGKKG